LISISADIDGFCSDEEKKLRRAAKSNAEYGVDDRGDAAKDWRGAHCGGA